MTASEYPGLPWRADHDDTMDPADGVVGADGRDVPATRAVCRLKSAAPEMLEALRLAVAMRAAQKAYFQRQSREALSTAKAAERAFDKAAERALRKAVSGE